MNSRAALHKSSRVGYWAGLVVATLFVLTGCASIVNSSQQELRVDVIKVDGSVLDNASCEASNDEGKVRFTSGETVKVHRSNKPLIVVCTDQNNLQAQASVKSDTGKGSTSMNFLMGGLVFGTTAQLLDHNRGTAYHYPTWIRMVSGESLVFDRSSENLGQPTIGKAISSK